RPRLRTPWHRPARWQRLYWRRRLLCRWRKPADAPAAYRHRCDPGPCVGKRWPTGAAGLPRPEAQPRQCPPLSDVAVGCCWRWPGLQPLDGTCRAVAVLSHRRHSHRPSQARASVWAGHNVPI
ncbi:hypothetical protein GGI23_006658, partial [Coemansia sp. RSA 2559]